MGQLHFTNYNYIVNYSYIHFNQLQLQLQLQAITVRPIAITFLNTVVVK